MKRLLALIFALTLATPAWGQLVGPNGGSSGSAFNPAAPGAIGGTTSSTGQFTALCTGTSPCTLPTNGDISAQRSATTGEIQLGDANILENLALSGFSITAGAVANGALFNMRGFDNFSITGTDAPAITSCGTGSPTATGNNSAFVITTGTTVTTCTATFNTTKATFANAPVCIFQDVTSNPLSFTQTSVSAASLVIAMTSTAAAQTINVHCIGH